MSTPAPLPINEPRRLEVLASCHLLDTGPEPVFDQIVAMAAILFGMPIAILTLIDERRQWFKSSIGLPYQEVSRDEAICSYTILSPEGMVIADTCEDARFASYQCVRQEPWIRFYAGMPLLCDGREAIGTLCVLDTRPRYDFDARALRQLGVLAREAMAHVELRRASYHMMESLREYRRNDSLERLYCRIAAAISETQGADRAWRVTLERLCAANGWTWGRVWAPGPDGALRCLAASNGEGPAALRLPLVDQAWREPGPVLLHTAEEIRIATALRDAGSVPVVLEFRLPGSRKVPQERIGEAVSLAERLHHLLSRKEIDERLRRQEAELSRTNSIKDHFLAMLAHELRNPLAPILNAVALLRSPDPGDAVEIIERQVRHMARLMEDLLDVSRITQGKLLLRKQVMDLGRSVEAAIRTARNLFESRGQPFEARLVSQPLPVEADPVRMEQVVANLLHNAAKYTPPERPVTLELGREGEEAVLRVRDSGMGIGPEMLEAIFEPFVQGPHPMAGSGLGIGLALVRQLVGLHGGTIRAVSEGVGLGAEFIVRLPLTRQPVGAAPRPESETPVGQRRRRVLVVEDNRDLVSTLRRLLMHWGHEVATVSRGDEALAEALAFRPDVALVDLGLPGGMDGYALARRLADAPELKGLVLAALTGYNQEKDRREAAAAGFHHYLLKPVDPGHLMRLLAGEG